MAFPPRSGSHVPKIKCTTCGQDVDMIMMAEHICSNGPQRTSSQHILDVVQHWLRFDSRFEALQHLDGPVLF